MVYDASDKRDIIFFFLFLHENILWLLIRSASSKYVFVRNNTKYYG